MSLYADTSLLASYWPDKCAVTVIRVKRHLLRRSPLPLNGPAPVPQIGLDPACPGASSAFGRAKPCWAHPDSTPGR